MKALILNSGMGSRMGKYTAEHPKCMTSLIGDETILSRQLMMIENVGIKDVVITTGYFNEVLVEYCNSLKTNLNINFVYNPNYAETNYIFSIYNARKELEKQDVLLMHGDLVFDESVLCDIMQFEKSCMKVSSTIPLPEKDFKAVVDNKRIKKVGVEFFDNAMEAQALYKLNVSEWEKWLNKIVEYCENGICKCYAENAFNEISDNCVIYGLDVENRLCTEIDTPEDWQCVLNKLISG